ncbi:MAG: 4Fe-4S dicluster domain-containing protein, partial [Candidatus Brockarchaeota archaeon]|nr:4Fe-4S dicluster domain-containing protein [Candidatus Brockarchaeota archaeon]
MREELMRNGAPNLARCIQCGTCTAGCTVYELDQSYNPRKLIQTILVGEAKVDLEKAWLCSTCGICTERCPKGVWPMNVMLSARGLMVQGSKGVPKERIRSLYSIFESGFAYPRRKGLELKRSSLGLPDLSL